MADGDAAGRTAAAFIADLLAHTQAAGDIVGLVMVVFTRHGMMAAPHLAWWHAESVADQLTVERMLKTTVRACSGADTN